MKTMCMYLVAGLIYTQAQAQDKNTKLFHLVRTWGLLKYYHPAIQKGMIDWDEAFVSQAGNILQKKDQDLASITEQLISATGRPGIKAGDKNFYAYYKDSAFSNIDIEWLKNKDLPIHEKDREYLVGMVVNYRPRKNKYIKKEINKFYFNTPRNKYWFAAKELPDTTTALLMLARYWNIIRFFYPHHDNLNKTWEAILSDFIPRVISAAGSRDIFLVFAELTASLNDGHAFYNNYEFDNFIGMARPAILVAFINKEKTVVTYIGEKLQAVTGIQKGDIINAVNGKEINARRAELARYLGGSHAAARDRNIDAYLLLGHSGQQFEIAYTNRDGKVNNTHFQLTDELKFNPGRISPKPAFQLYPDLRTSYIRLSGITWKQMNKIINALPGNGNLVLDFRYGGQLTKWNKLLGKFTNKKVLMAKYYNCSFTIPGYFSPKSIYKKSVLSSLSKKYKGRVIVLADDRVMSSMEFHLMMLKAAIPSMTIIGKPTAGADGAATSVLVAENLLTYFTRDVVLFPDKKKTQGIGIEPDIYVQDDVNMIRQGRDTVLEAAFQLIKKENSY